MTRRATNGILRSMVTWAVGTSRADDVLGDIDELAAERRGFRRDVVCWRHVLSLVLRSAFSRGVSLAQRGLGRPEGGWVQDIRFAARSYQRTPVLTAAILVTLALGVGANTAIFSVVDAVMLRSLPFPDPDRLVLLWEREPGRGLLEPFSPPNLEDARSAITGLDGLAGWTPERYAMTGQGDPEQILTVRATRDFFEVLGASAAFGRVFDAGDDGDLATIVLSHGFWTRRFGGEPGVIGQTVTLDYTPYEVIGVMPSEFSFPAAPDIAGWLPLVRYPWEQIRHTRNTQTIARLGAGATLERVQREASAVAGRMARAHPGTNAGYGILVQRAEVLVGDNRTLLILLGAVGIVLLIACANVANLLMARARERGRELALRMSLGASRSRILRQLLVESGVLAAVGSILGLAMAWLGVRLLLSLEPGALPSWNAVGLNGTVLAFAAVVAVFVTFAAGLGPAVRASRADVVGRLHQDGLRQGRGRPGAGTRGVLSIVEVALAVVLLVGAGLMVTSLTRLLRVDPGFVAEGLMTATIELPDTRYSYGSGDMERAFQGILERARELPMVTGAGWVTTLPMNPVGTDYDIEFYSVEHPDRTPAETPARADFRVLSDGYFEAMRIPLIRGRTLTETDREDSQPVAIVNQTLAERFFPGEDPVGKHLQVYAPEGEGYQIVGVVGDVKHRGLDDPSRSELYLPYRQMTHGEMSLVVRYSGLVGPAVDALRGAVAHVDADLPLIAVREVPALLRDTVAERRFYMTLLLSFAGLGLLLAVVGVYGTLSHTVGRRRREIGVRMAVGARRQQVVGLVLLQGMRLVGFGLVAGLLGSALLSRSLRSLLFEVHPGDPVTLVAVVTVVMLVAALACWVPAHRASRVEPTIALREG